MTLFYVLESVGQLSAAHFDHREGWVWTIKKIRAQSGSAGRLIVAAQNSNIQLEEVYTRSTSNVEIFTRRRPYFASSVAGAEAAQLGISCAMQADAKEEPSRRSKISTFEVERVYIHHTFKYHLSL